MKSRLLILQILKSVKEYEKVLTDFEKFIPKRFLLSENEYSRIMKLSQETTHTFFDIYYFWNGINRPAMRKIKKLIYSSSRAGISFNPIIHALESRRLEKALDDYKKLFPIGIFKKIKIKLLKILNFFKISKIFT